MQACTSITKALIWLPDHIFVPTGKMGLVNCLFHFIQVHWNAGTLLFFNLMLDLIEDYIPHYTQQSAGDKMLNG